MNKYCAYCGTTTKLKVERRQETFSVKKDPVTITSNVMVCTGCGNDLFDEKLDGQNLEQAYDIYRRKHGLVSPQDIIALREKYGLSQRSLGALLGWGEITIHRYETGMLPDEAHNGLLALLDRPANVMELFERNKSKLKPAIAKKLELKLNEFLLLDEKNWTPFVPIAHEENEFTGYKSFNIDVFNEVVLYVLSELGGTFKTKLNKLLWYIDFYNFKVCEKSINGCVYVHLQYGPVPDKYEYLLCLMHQNKLIGSQEVTFDDKKDIAGEFIKAKAKSEIKLISAKEKKHIDHILKIMGHLTASELTKRSHEEKGYKETSSGHKISYNYAKQITF
ncbi:MAG: DUF4065 domain-containing protein [Candidatus Edwardsbacteria bacterium]|nr:DUF4065 domain-containing protein [Candidatus Edwardsbacteria bacterium]